MDPFLRATRRATRALGATLMAAGMLAVSAAAAASPASSYKRPSASCFFALGAAAAALS